MAYIRCNENTGRGNSYVIEGFSMPSLPLTKLIDVTDDYKGTSASDMVLSNCPSISDFYTLFYDKYLNASIPNYTVTKKSLGKDQSNTYDLYEYDFCPSGWDRMILLTSGMNGYEVAGIFGLAYFLQAIIENHDNDPLLSYMFRKVRIKVIPLINPWGYAQSPKEYRQSRGVNINRNFDINGRWAAYPSYPEHDSNPNNYKGTAPFSETETQILRVWAEDNLAAEFWIDCHTGLLTKDKAVYTASLSNSVIRSKVNVARPLFENWTKSYYNLQSVQTNYIYDGDAAMKQYWYEGVYGNGMMVLEQCSDCAAIGNTKNGSANAIYNYVMLIYAYVGAFLEKDAQTVNIDTYINSLVQDGKSATKYYIPRGIVRDAVDLTSISAVKTKTTYDVGDTLNTDDIVVTAHYSDNTSTTVTATISTSAVNMSVEGTYNIAVSYTEDGITKSTSISISVNALPVNLTSITAIKAKTSYNVGDTINTDDIVTTAHYSDNSSKQVTAVVDTSNVDMSTDGTYSISLSYTEDGVTKSTSISISVAAVPVEVNYITIKQGTIDTGTGDPVASATRIYSEDYIPIGVNSNPFHVVNLAGNGRFIFSRIYNGSKVYQDVTLDIGDNRSTYYTTAGVDNGLASEGKSGRGIAQDISITIRTPSLNKAKYMRFAIANDDGSNIVPSDVDGRVISIDGVEYTLRAES